MNLPSLEICQQIVELHGQIGSPKGEEKIEELIALLKVHGLGYTDLPRFFDEYFALVNKAPSALPHKDRKKFCGLHAMMGTAGTTHERTRARNNLIKLLAEESLNWAVDLPAVLAAAPRRRRRLCRWRIKGPRSTGEGRSGQTPGTAQVRRSLCRTRR
jgi:hypothetical protein